MFSNTYLLLFVISTLPYIAAQAMVCSYCNPLQFKLLRKVFRTDYGYIFGTAVIQYAVLCACNWIFRTYIYTDWNT